MVSSSVKLLLSAFGLMGFATAAVQCDLVASDDCGRNSHSLDHKLPTSVGSTFFADGFHGGVVNAKFESETQSVSGNSQYVDLTYNFNLGDYDGTYWVQLPTSFGGGTSCYAVYKNCDVIVKFWDKNNPVPDHYTLA
ncbi:predicted protein [Aspergillus terreus NIH2624]|uniref:AA1-like domain-containing protein n=1 Tax=Aspergillus terreus (strain NIH 2624 / FGSC A1156) TaxID=341663 RepID=Q0CJA8_ASPTN|nr:uncharacterized protein ATEG_06226 [Aspergillus terreus NIH2624]EAU33987.1 predicted protein [Aspergillus terreus NIH2624]